MKNPKVGDRVAVYDRNFNRSLGKIVSLSYTPKELYLNVILDGNENMFNTYNVKQCRRLVPKKRKHVTVMELAAWWNASQDTECMHGNSESFKELCALVGAKK